MGCLSHYEYSELTSDHPEMRSTSQQPIYVDERVKPANLSEPLIEQLEFNHTRSLFLNGM